MELTIERGKFLNELQILQGVVERKNTIPILANILLKAENGGLDLTSTDLDLTLHTQVGAKISSPGGVCVPARKLFDLNAIGRIGRDVFGRERLGFRGSFGCSERGRRRCRLGRNERRGERRGRRRLERARRG